MNAELPEIDPSLARSACIHCGTELNEIQKQDGEQFCCKACAYVYQSIHALGLGDYYQMRGESRARQRAPDSIADTYLFADSIEFLSLYCRPLDGGLLRLSLELEGIHCAACVWLLERLPIFVEGVTSARVFFADNLLEVTLLESCKRSFLLHEIERLGYKVRPLENSAQGDIQISSSRRSLVRIGVAAVCALNAMMLAVSLYQGEVSGIDPDYQRLLEFYSLALSLPALCYSAVPFYRTALGGLRAGVLHIDLPIVAALLGGFGISVYNTFRGNGGVYYDSITTVIFLLLSARFLQNRIVQRIAGRKALLSAVLPIKAQRLDSDGRRQSTFTGALKCGDVLAVSAGEVLAVDGIVSAGSGQVSLAFLSGESRPFEIQSGSKVFAGSQLLSGEVRVAVEQVGAETRVGKLIGDVLQNEGQKPEIELFLDRRSRGFTAIVVTLALGTVFYWGAVDLPLAIERTIALLLVTCPCVLALATPIAFSIGLSRAARHGILIRNAEAIERLQQIDHLIFDKTGTLTSGSMQVRDWWQVTDSSLKSGCRESNAEALAIIAQLERSAEHPIAEALRAFTRQEAAKSSPPVRDCQTLDGFGITGLLGAGERVLIGSPHWDEMTAHLSPSAHALITRESQQGFTPVIFFDQRYPDTVLVFSIGDHLKAEAAPMIQYFKNRSMTLSMLSGDQRNTALSIASKLGIAPENCFAPCTPVEKIKQVERCMKDSCCAMIGDGLNDIGAFSKATVSIGMTGGAESALKVAEVYIAGGDLTKIPLLLKGSAAVMRSVHTGLFVSACYNVIGAIGAFSGYIGPLEAAVLMPISSLSSIAVIASCRSFR